MLLLKIQNLLYIGRAIYFHPVYNTFLLSTGCVTFYMHALTLELKITLLLYILPYRIYSNSLSYENKKGVNKAEHAESPPPLFSFGAKHYPISHVIITTSLKGSQTFLH